MRALAAGALGAAHARVLEFRCPRRLLLTGGVKGYGMFRKMHFFGEMFSENKRSLRSFILCIKSSENKSSPMLEFC